MASSFADQLWQQFLVNLADSINALGLSDPQLSTLVMDGLGQLAVSLVLLGVFALAYLPVAVVLKLVGKRMGRSRVLVHHLLVGLRYLFLLLALLALMGQYGASADLVKATTRAGFLALGFYALWLAASRLLHEFRRRYHFDPSLGQLLKNSLSVLLVVFAAVTVLSQFGFDVVSIVAGLGIVGIAVGFAAQSTLSNFIAGVTLLIERPFRIGDWVRINDQEGKVIKIALRTTWLRTRDNIFTMIPNDNVASSDIVNFSAEGEIRLRLPLGIAYKETASAAREVILPVLQDHPDVMKRPGRDPSVRMIGLGDSSIDLEALAWIGPYDIDFRVRISCELYEGIKAALDDAGIQIPFPHRQLFIDEAKGLAPWLDSFREHPGTDRAQGEES
ncbi:MAG: mechanosensitive ion channel family protein [Marinobacter sp.]|uniref:mechanosensitive ion channel family protein n=1 Tax=Marinobacter sp. TaxID=50741 RepID=UPI00299F365A|nr:mechanosensitive ion channel family protein [Marinobacter sp.]MDX1634633.1 mechanosensitive ion channel family protein [Marinobacter sp.]